jgi:uncharacterized protein (TIGR03435 family)
VVWTAVLIGTGLLPVVSVVAPQLNIAVLPARNLPVTTPSAFALPSPAQPFAPPTYAPQPAPTPATFAAPSRDTLIVAVYFAGVLAIFAYRAMGWALLRRVVARSSPVHGRLRQSADVLTPVAAGVIHPAVILPMGWRAWSAETRRAVLAHEFAHLRRRDTAVAALARLVQCVFWFQPLVWLLSRTIANLAESACDAAALERVHDPGGYSRILLQFAGHRAALPGLAMATSANMGRRIDQIFELSRGHLRRLSRPATAAALLGLPVLCLAASITLGEQQDATHAFEVASIKIWAPRQGGGRGAICLTPCYGERIAIEHSRVEISSITLNRLLVTAYRIRPHQLVPPSWAKDPTGGTRFDILATMPAGATKDQMHEMLQALLAERFKVTVHRETRQLPVYAIVVAKDGPKLKPSAESDAPVDENSLGGTIYTPQGEAHDLKDGGVVLTGSPWGTVRMAIDSDGTMRESYSRVSMPALAELLSGPFDNPIVDMTNLKGTYQISWDRAGVPGGRRGPRAEADGPGPDLRADWMAENAKKLEKLGLKLESRKAPVQVLVVDRLEKMPTEN